MPSRMVGSECNKSRLRWKERAEKAEKILAMQKEAEEGHPDMCCGQCHRLIAEARGEADSLRSRLEQAEKDRDGYRKGGELALADAVKAHAALKLAQETLQKSEFGKLQVEAERDKALEDLDALRGEVRRLREAIDSFNQNPT